MAFKWNAAIQTQQRSVTGANFGKRSDILLEQSSQLSSLNEWFGIRKGSIQMLSCQEFDESINTTLHVCGSGREVEMEVDKLITAE